jgi:diacylglycerol kinase (ATP)
MKKLIFIVNPKAKNGKALGTWRKVKARLDARNVPYEAYFTKYPNHSPRLVKEILAHHKLQQTVIVAIGGDGTVHEAINGLVGSENVAFTTIPAGSGNDFARGFHLSFDVKQATEQILQLLHTDGQPVDIGEYKCSQYQKGYFVNNIGAGLDALIAKKANESRLKKWLNKLNVGNIIYVFYFLKEIMTYRPVHVRITVDETEYEFSNTWLVAVCNQPYYGGGMKISPQSNYNDGLLDLVVISNIPRYQLITLFASVFWGGHTGLDGVTVLRGKEFHIESERPLFIQADGETVGNTPFHVRCRSKAWTLLR